MASLVPNTVQNAPRLVLPRSKVKKQLQNENLDFLYVATADTAIALRGLFEKKYKYLEIDKENPKRSRQIFSQFLKKFNFEKV